MADGSRGTSREAEDRSGYARADDRPTHRSRRDYSEDFSDDDYRPRRPTCSIGIQAAVPVDVGIQCELQAESRAPDDPFGPWMQVGHHPSMASSAPVGAAGLPAAMVYGLPPHPYYGGGFAPPVPYAAMPPSPYPHWGGYMMPSQAPPPLGPSSQPQLAAPNSLLRHLFGAAVAAPRVGGFNPPVRASASAQETGSADDEASEAPRRAEGDAAATTPSAASFPGAPSPPIGSAVSFGMPFPQAFGLPYVQQPPPVSAFGAAAVPHLGTAFGGASPAAVAALGMVDESFREQIELLRKAAARHRSLLEKAQMPAPSHATAPLNATATATPASLATVEATAEG